MSATELTELLAASRNGDRAASDAVFARVYRDLHRLAHRQLASGGGGPGRHSGETLNTTALVHEAYLRLVPGRGLPVESRAHFFNLAARVMRNVVVDFVRRKSADKRGGEVVRVTLTGSAELAAQEDSRLSADLLALHAALERLEGESPRLARLVELHFFAGLTFEEIAELLGMGERTVKRHWRSARAFLLATLTGRLDEAGEGDAPAG
jgi:RNA polymerase sigma factor (TIGR02999 family)